ncbi:MAG: DUF6502 family protein [Burkholderiaceae bacterium]
MNPPTQPSRADVLLDESLTIMAPLARALIAHGVTYPRFAQALKQVFLDAARAELAQQGKKPSDSALSLRSGVHRKDVRTFTERGALKPSGHRTLSMASLVFAKWSRDAAYVGADGSPRALPLRSRAADELSFETLTWSISKDFHPRSVLDELLRLNLAAVEGETVRLKAEAFVPTEAFTDLAHFFGANLRDHAAASADNLLRAGRDLPPRFLERATFADGLTEASIEMLDRLAREIWTEAAKRMYEAAARRVEADAGAAPEHADRRMRFGMYFYSEPVPPSAEGDR